MKLDYENLWKMISLQAGFYRERNLQPEEIIRRYRYHSAKYAEYVTECDNGSWIAHYINKKALERIAEEREIELNGDETTQKEQGTTNGRGTL